MTAQKRKTGKSPKSDIEKFRKRAIELGAKKAKIIRADSIITAPWVRLKCRYGCPMYGEKLTCPPYSPDPETTRAMLDDFDTAVLIRGELTGLTQLVSDLEREVFLAGYHKAFSMGNGPCSICETCPVDEGCRYPYDARPSMEACGIDVYRTVRNNGWKIEVVKDYGDEGRYFGVVLVE